jgi:integrase
VVLVPGWPALRVPSLGRVKLAELSPAHIDAFLADVRSGRLRPDRDYRGEGGTLSPRTILHIFACLRVLCSSAVRRRMIPYNPCAGVELESPGQHEASVWGPEEAGVFLAHAEEHEPRLAIAFRLALKFGLRRGEILALPWTEAGDDTHVRYSATQVGPRW